MENSKSKKKYSVNWLQWCDCSPTGQKITTLHNTKRSAIQFIQTAAKLQKFGEKIFWTPETSKPLKRHNK